MDNDRKEQLRQQIAERVSQFAVGDTIEFSMWDDSGCNEYTGDPIQFDLIGKILSIDGHHAMVEHKYGICKTMLSIAKKVENAH